VLREWVDPDACTTIRDCGCCGARSAMQCIERGGHAIHALVCRNCGRDRDCR